MFNESYDDYIRSILGYPTNQSNLYENYGYDTQYSNLYRNSNDNLEEMEECYPEIYKVVYPMVQKVCDRNNAPVTRELIENMTDEIYFAIEAREEVNIQINLTNEIKNNSSSTPMNRNTQSKVEVKPKPSEKEENSKKEDRQDRQINRGLRDIIKILLLRELLNRPNFPHRPRPPFPGGPRPRPPFSEGPMPGPRPPIMPRYQSF